MSPRFLRWFGYAWAAPLTVLGLFYVLLFSFMEWYTFVGRHGDALVWQLNRSLAPDWVDRSLLRWGGHAIGNVVVVKVSLGSKLGKIGLRHEQEHVHQCMVFGVFQPVIYAGASLVLFFCRNSHPHYDNPLEIDARRAAGQVIDVIGTLRLVLTKAREQREARTLA